MSPHCEYTLHTHIHVHVYKCTCSYEVLEPNTQYHTEIIVMII